MNLSHACFVVFCILWDIQLMCTVSLSGVAIKHARRASETHRDTPQR